MLRSNFKHLARGSLVRPCATALILALSLMPVLALAIDATEPSIDRVRLGEFVDELVLTAMHRDDIAGVAVAIVDKSGPLLIRGYGTAGQGRAVDADTLFPVQSISKTLVWIALMQLAEQWKIRLDDPINSHLPAVLQIPDEGFSAPIRVRNLIDHTSGLEDSAFGHLFVQRAESLLPLETYLANFRVRRVREPGKVLVYSNYGAALGGALVAYVSGMPWEDYAEQRIIAPLSMGNATFRQPYSQRLAKMLALPAPMRASIATHLTSGFRRVSTGLEEAPREFTADFPAGALVASPKSMSAYMSALLDPQLMESAGVLKAQTLLAMRTPEFTSAAGFGDSRSGFQPIALPGDIEAFGHGGDSIYQVASMTLVPGRGLGIFVSANTASGRGLTVRLRQELASKFLGGELAPPVYGASAGGEAMIYAGNYRNLRRPYFRTEHGLYDLLIDPISVSSAPNGDLQIRSFLNKPRSLVPMGGGVYRDRGGPEKIAFRVPERKVALYEPYADTAWERVGYFESAQMALCIIALTFLASVLGFVGAIYRIVAPRAEAGFEIYAGRAIDASSMAWLTGFVFLIAFVVKALTASNIGEIIWWYPSTAIICACWAFAIALTLTAASVPSVAVVIRTNGWPMWRKIAHAIEVALFLACGATFWRLGFIGFSGW
jgi:CubicO group peptidase (beta-lactamase class C family)